MIKYKIKIMFDLIENINYSYLINYNFNHKLNFEYISSYLIQINIILSYV